MRNLISVALLLAGLVAIIAAVMTRPRVGHPVTESMRQDAIAATSAIVGPLPVAIDRRPLVAIFILPGCPCSESYEPFTQQLHQAFGRQAQILGIVEGTEVQAQTWKQKHETPFTVIADSDGKIAHRFLAKRSAYTALIVEGDAIAKLWPGFSQEMLNELSQRLSDATGQEVPRLKFDDAPIDLASGCVIDSGDE